jgi:hypothetical protein
VTIAKGEPWGRLVALPAEVVRVRADAEIVARLLADPPVQILVTDGDVRRTLGETGTDVRAGGDAQVVEVDLDLIEVEVDGSPARAVAHVVITSGGWWSWGRGPIVAVMNVEHRGRADVAPRAHPNDGRLDIVEVAASMPLRARLAARRRLHTGTHVPHPDITTRQATAAEWTFDRPMRVAIDGVTRRGVRNVRVAIAPDACTVLV